MKPVPVPFRGILRQMCIRDRQKTEELNHAKLQFFTNVTHELLTPLTIILTSLQNLNNGTGDNQTPVSYPHLMKENLSGKYQLVTNNDCSGSVTG